MSIEEFKDLVSNTLYYKWNQALVQSFFNEDKAEREVYLFKGFVYFNISGERLTFGIYHSHTKALEHGQATRYFVPSVRSSVLADKPFLAVLTCHAASNHVVSGVRVLSKIVPAWA